MAESGGSSTHSILSTDPGWRYFQLVTPGNKNDLRCIFCSKIFKGGIYRAKQHLAGGHRNALPCNKCPPTVRDEIIQFMNKKKAERVDSSSQFHSSYDEQDFNLNSIDEDVQPTQNERSIPSSATGSSMQNKRKKQGPMDMFIQKSAGPREKERQMTMNEAFNKEMREKGIMAVANWMYDAAIPFNAVNYPSFQVMCDIISRHGPGFRGPSYHEVRVNCLDKAVAQVEQDYIAACKLEWSKYGCSLMVDGWTDKRQRTLINFLVNSPRGSVFIEFVDASEYTKTGQLMADLIDRVIVKIGVENVVQVITDNASNMVLAGKILEAKRPNLYWTPCAAHCIDLMLEDIGKLPTMKLTLKKAMSVTAYIYVRPGVVHMLRSFTNQKELCRAGVTRFATAFLTLQRMLELKQNLKNMFTSQDWAQSKWSNEADGKKVANIIISPKFWNSVMHILKIYNPLVHVLRLVDGEKKPAMGYIYEAMDRAKEAIKKTFNGKEDHYKDAFAIIDKRWDCQLHKPLHAAGFFLNPEFFYTSTDMDEEVSNGFYDAMARLVSDADEQNKIVAEMDAYRNAKGSFAVHVAVRQRGELAPAVWWENFAASAPHLRKFAVKVVSLTCSSSGCERNWSIFENVHSKRRNRLEQQRMNDLVFVKYNRALMRRCEARGQIDPISLKDIDESNEWMIGRMDDEDELVFVDDDLDWGIVAKASGAEEPAYDTRAKGKKQAIDHVPKGSKQVETGRGSKGKGKGKGKSGPSGGGSSRRLRDEEIEFDYLEPPEEEEKEFNEEDPQFDDEEEEEDDFDDEFDNDDD